MLRRTEQTYKPSSLFSVKTSAIKTQRLLLENFRAQFCASLVL